MDNNTKWFIYSDQPSLFWKQPIVWFGTAKFYIKELDRDIANKMIVENHYSKKFYNATYIHLGVYIDWNIVWVLQYWYAMNPASQASVVSDTLIDEYLELNRMRLSDIAPKNSESMAVSYSIKYIKRKYPKIKRIQSFADERCWCFGIVYQACNFYFYWEHIAKFWTLDWEVFHNSLMTRNPKLSKSAEYIQKNKDRATSEELRQFRYIYFINRKYKQKCLLKEKEYLKYYKWD